LMILKWNSGGCPNFRQAHASIDHSQSITNRLRD
jgi:hypothetical protein